MDAYDIFKKISRGAKFSRKHNPKPSNNVKIKEENSTNVCIKVERDIDEYDINEKLIKEEKPTQENSITLLNSMKNVPERKGKKRKHVGEKQEEHKRKLLEQEQINHYRNVNNISVVGKHIPEPAKVFEEFAVKPDLIENLKKCGYVEPTPIQKQAIPILLQGRQLLACAPTGSGKTAAFLLPIINDLVGPERQGFRALILCPTRELAKQTQRECIRLSEGRGFRVHVISKINKALSQYGPQSSQKFDILITTPNRLCFLLKQDPPALSLANIKWVIIDEADKLFEDGNRGFREQLDQIIDACTNAERKIGMFSATYAPVVAKWCVRNMKGLIRVTVGQRNAANELVDQELLFVGNEQGKLLAFRELVRKGLNPPVLVFVQSKERAQQLFSELIYDGINVDAIHADRTQLQRDNTVRSFREGKIWVLICTELMARGVDFKGVNLVINYDFPPSAISYVHRIGRAGRAGRKGKAITFFTVDDNINLRSIAFILKESGCEVPPYMLTMKKKSKKEKKELEKRAPKRKDITTTPIYERMQKERRRRRIESNIKGLNEDKKESDETKVKAKNKVEFKNSKNTLRSKGKANRNDSKIKKSTKVTFKTKAGKQSNKKLKNKNK